MRTVCDNQVAILFPGQGAQTPDMRDHVAATRPDLLAFATECVGEDPFLRADEDTRFAQPAILTASLARFGELSEYRPPAAVAGHSLGELTALAAARAISERDAIALAALRGRLMGDCPGDGAMLAALGGDAEAVVALAGRHEVTVANDNAPGQLVLSGERSAIGTVAAALREAGVRVLELNVAGAFHSPLMAPAVPEFVAALEATYIRTPRVPVYSGVIAAPVDDIRRRLAEALTAPVRWRETVLSLSGAGIGRFVDAGPGKVLAGTVKRITRDPELVHA